MDLFENLISSGRIVDFMVAVLAFEIVAVTWYRRARGGGIAFRPLILNIGAGGSLMLALKASLIDAGTTWIAACLLMSLVFHVADQANRWE